VAPKGQLQWHSLAVSATPHQGASLVGAATGPDGGVAWGPRPQYQANGGDQHHLNGYEKSSDREELGWTGRIGRSRGAEICARSKPVCGRAAEISAQHNQA